MQTALIIMTILGCDDSATQCHFVEMLDQRWATIQACDAEAEARLSGYNNISYPVVVAVCQTPGDTDLAEAASETGPGNRPMRLVSRLVISPNSRFNPPKAKTRRWTVLFFLLRTSRKRQRDRARIRMCRRMLRPLKHPDLPGECSVRSRKFFLLLKTSRR
jgi:hypothetical protein